MNISTRAWEPSINKLYHRLLDGNIILQPEFQRYYVWDDKKASKIDIATELGGDKMLKLEFYVPQAFKDTQEVKKVEELLKKVKSSLKINVKKLVIDENGEEDLKPKIFWELSVAKKIRIKTYEKIKISLSATCCFWK